MSTAPNRPRIWQGLSGVLFAALFIFGEPIAGAFASGPLPLPWAPASEVIRYYDGSRLAVLVTGFSQSLSAVSLLIFAACVASVLRRAGKDGSAPSERVLAAGGLSASLLVASALLALALVPAAAGGDVAVVGVLRTLNFLSGGTFHVAALGLFVGAASLTARRVKALPGWICWLGIAAAVSAVLSLASLLLFPATVLILLGRLLGFAWCVAAGIALAIGKKGEFVVGAG